MEVQGRRNRGKPKRRWLDSVRDDIREKGVSGEGVYDWATWATWRRIILSSKINPT